MKKRDNIIYRESQHFRTAKSFGNCFRKRVFKTFDLECKSLGVKHKPEGPQKDSKPAHLPWCLEPSRLFQFGWSYRILPTSTGYPARMEKQSPNEITTNVIGLSFVINSMHLGNNFHPWITWGKSQYYSHSMYKEQNSNLSKWLSNLSFLWIKNVLLKSKLSIYLCPYKQLLKGKARMDPFSSGERNQYILLFPHQHSWAVCHLHGFHVSTHVITIILSIRISFCSVCMNLEQFSKTLTTFLSPLVLSWHVQYLVWD